MTPPGRDRPRPPGQSPQTRAQRQQQQRQRTASQRQQQPGPQISRRGFLVAAGATAVGGAVIAFDLLGGGGGASRPSVKVLPGAEAVDPATHTFNLAITNGRVLDPETRYDQVANVGIDGASITAITPDPIKAQATIDAKGLVVAPGFIDILSYEPNEYGIWFKVADGVTTNLGLHGLRARAADFFSTWGSDAKRPPTNYGGAFSDPWTRSTLGLGIGDAATPAQIDQLVALCAEDLKNGYIAVDFEPEYTPGVAYDEIKALAEVAKDHHVPATFHARYSDDVSPGTNAEALAEVLRVARDTGAHVHVEHIISTGGTYTMKTSLATLEKARAEGLHVTACTYPYDFWATYLASARFDSGWQERFHITYKDLAIVGSGERLTPASFAKYQSQNALTAAYAIPESDVREALRADWVMLGSDAILEPGDKNHPRSTGCFARAIGRYTRDYKVIDLMAAVAKATILPAQLLHDAAPVMRRKGRLQVGADADVTVFDPETLIDKSTIRAPGTESEGVRFVLVGGQLVRDATQGNRREARQGAAILSR